MIQIQIKDFFKSHSAAASALRTKTRLGFKNFHRLFFASIKKSNLNQIGIGRGVMAKNAARITSSGCDEQYEKRFCFFAFQKKLIRLLTRPWLRHHLVTPNLIIPELKWSIEF